MANIEHSSSAADNYDFASRRLRERVLRQHDGFATSQTRRRFPRRFFPGSMAALATMAYCLTRTADATLSVGNLTFDSMPGLFGLPWRPDAQYRAHVQFLPENPFLCHYHYPNKLGLNETGVDEPIGSSLVAPMDGVPGSSRIAVAMFNFCQCCRLTYLTIIWIFLPLAVALLAQRGNCSFAQKIQVAMAYSSSRARIQFCIVYDDEPRPNLIAMQAVDYASLTANIHTLFVSLVTGLRK